MALCDEFEDEEEISFMDIILPNLSEIESSIKESLGFEQDSLEQVAEWLKSMRDGNREPLDTKIYAKAIDRLEQGMEYIPSNERGFHDNIDEVLFIFSGLAKDVTKVKFYFKRIADKNPADYKKISDYAGCFLHDAPDYEFAREVFQDLAQKLPNDFEINLNLGFAFFRTGEYRGAKMQSVKCLMLGMPDPKKKESASALYWGSREKLGERTEYSSSPEDQIERKKDFMNDLFQEMEEHQI